MSLTYVMNIFCGELKERFKYDETKTDVIHKILGLETIGSLLPVQDLTIPLSNIIIHPNL
jgi:hypothetical protein